jgi:hypothetical protein
MTPARYPNANQEIVQCPYGWKRYGTISKWLPPKDLGRAVSIKIENPNRLKEQLGFCQYYAMGTGGGCSVSFPVFFAL